jgi:hypothetical protein
VIRAAIVCMWMLAGCGRGAKSDSFLDDAKQQVRTFFSAAASDDCTTLRTLHAKLTSQKDCEGFLHLWHEDNIQLVEILDAKRDGRDARAAIVRVRMETRNKSKDVLVRAVRDQNHWNIVF